MNIASIKELREALMKLERKSENSSRDDSLYPFWNMKDGESCLIRFLPDADETNTFFWRERQIIKLPFRGTKEDPNRNVVVQVPCIEMYGKMRCPIMEEIQPWFKDPEREDLARTYWKKKSYVFQGFIVQDPLNERSVENPIRKLVINTSIFKIIKSSLMDPDIEDSPVDFEKGRDFKLEKTKKGAFSDYSTSKWSMKTRALNPYELEAIETYGLRKLSDLLPREPNEKEIHVIYEMFKASVAGELYDQEKWGDYYRPNIFSYDDELTETLKRDLISLNSFDVKNVDAKRNEAEKNKEKFLNALSNSRSTDVDSDENDETLKSNVEPKETPKTENKKIDPLAILESLKKNKRS